MLLLIIIPLILTAYCITLVKKLFFLLAINFCQYVADGDEKMNEYVDTS